MRFQMRSPQVCFNDSRSYMESSFKTESKQGIFLFKRDIKDEGLVLTLRQTCPKSRCAGGEVVVEPSFEDILT